MKRMMGPREPNLCKLWTGVFAVALLLVFPLPSHTQVGLPEGPGKQLVATACTQCHAMDGVINLRLSRQEWGNLVDDMIARGAPAFGKENEVISEYLTRNFGKDSGNPTDSNTATSQAARAPSVAEGPGRELLESSCTQCHTLSLVTDAKYNRNEWQEVMVDMIARGAMVPEEDVDAIVQYLTDNYGPDGRSPVAGGATVPQEPEESAGVGGLARLPEGAGKELVTTACTQCHGLDNVITLRLSRQEWENLVDDMIARGAPVFDEQYKVILEYLSTNFGEGN